MEKEYGGPGDRAMRGRSWLADEQRDLYGRAGAVFTGDADQKERKKMKVACERCNEIMNENKGIKIQWSLFETIVLCNKCYKELRGWIYGEKEEAEK